MAKDILAAKEEPRYVSPLEWVGGPGSMAFPETDQWKQRFMVNMIEYFRSETYSFRLQDFCDKYGYRRGYLVQIMDRHPEIKQVWEDIKPILGNRRFRGSILADPKISNGANLWKDIHQYDEDFKEVAKFHADLKKIDDKEGTGEFVIVQRPVKDTGLAKCPTE